MASATVVDGENISFAWLQAVKRLLACGGECFNLMVSINHPTEVDPEIDDAYRRLVQIHDLLTVRQVQYTIFPYSLYRGVGRDAHLLFDLYNRQNGVYERLRRRHGQKFGWGSYFRRMTHYPAANSYGHAITVNQLGEVIEMLKQRSRTYKAAYTITIQIPGVDGRRIMGGPCLSYIALQLDSRRVLNALAVYRNHDFIQRTYGNYLGLGRMMEFICDQTDYQLGELHCLSSHASLANLAGKASWPSTMELRSLFPGLAQP